jgi:predicted MPP superfamily phosphohydrolase
MKKRFVIPAAIAAAVVFAVIFLAAQNSVIGITEYTLYCENLPDSFSGFKITHISDVHTKLFDDFERKLEQTQPDIIVVTGDLIDKRNPDLEKAEKIIKAMSGVSQVYYVSGNHEKRHEKDGIYACLKAMLKKHGVFVLDGKKESISRGGDVINICGAGDREINIKGTDELSPSVIEELKEEVCSLVSADGFDILLFHRPSVFPYMCGTGADVIFSGHAHGGQVRLPVIAENGLFAPDEGWLPKYTSGTFESDGCYMVVSRGLGDSIIPVRVNNLPEIVCVALKSR